MSDKILVIEFKRDSYRSPLYVAENNSNVGYCREHPTEFLVREIRPEEWRHREVARIEEKIYQSLPDWWPYHDDHFAHPALKNPLLLSYTVNDEKGQADRQQPIKPGKYIQRFFPHLDAAEHSARWAAHFKPDELEFAATEDEIEAVYVDGPESCMGKPAEFFTGDNLRLPCHPARMYAAGDLQVAFIRREGRITARALVWPEKKTCGRIYGDSERLKPLLEKAGYRFTAEHSPGFYGAKLKRVEVGNGFVVPYVDWHSYVEDYGDYLVISRYDGASARNQYGSTNTNLWCEYANDWFDRDEARNVYNDRHDRVARWSPARLAAEAFQCGYSHDYFMNEFKVELDNGMVWSKYYADNYAAVCVATSRRLPRAECVEHPQSYEYYSRDYLFSLLPSSEERLAA